MAWSTRLTITVAQKSTRKARCFTTASYSMPKPMPLIVLKNSEKIKKRHRVVNYFLKQKTLLSDVTSHIKQIGDIERLISKVATAKVSPREVIQLKNSLDAIVPIKTLALKSENDALKVIGDNLQSCDLLRGKITETLNEEAPVNLLKGSTIARGFSKELDELRDIRFSGKEYLDKMLQRETEATGITSLKIILLKLSLKRI